MAVRYKLKLFFLLASKQEAYQGPWASCYDTVGIELDSRKESSVQNRPSAWKKCNGCKND